MIKNPECQAKELELNSVCNKSLSEGFYFIFLLLRFFFVCLFLESLTSTKFLSILFYE